MNETQRRNAALLTAAFATVYLVWGSTYLAIRVAVETMPPFLMASARFLLAGVPMMVVALLRGVPWPGRLEWRDAAISGGLMLAGGNALVAWAEQSVSSSLAALIVATVPAWFAVFDWARPGGKRPALITVGGIAVGFVGVALLLTGKPASGAGLEFTVIGLVAMLFSTAFWAAGSVYAKHGHKPDSALMFTAIQMTCGGFIQLIIACIRGEFSVLNLSGVSTHSWLAWGYLLVFGSVIAFNAFTYMLRHATPAKVSTYAFVNPVVAVFLGWAILDEPVTTRMLWAMAVIVAGVLLVTLGPGWLGSVRKAMAGASNEV